jgi:hypothetical protein
MRNLLPRIKLRGDMPQKRDRTFRDKHGGILAGFSRISSKALQGKKLGFLDFF